jgi:hypothetical protein
MQLFNVCVAAAAAALGLLSASTAHGHDLPENRATLVLRDQTHVALTLYIDYVETLHQALAPQKSAHEFLLISAALSPEAFQLQVQRAHAKLQSETRATLNGSGAAKITGWVWPDPAKIKVKIQQQVMAAMVGDRSHTHEAPIEIRANITDKSPINEATIQFPKEFGKMLIVWYRPKQIWVTPQQPSATMKF